MHPTLDKRIAIVTLLLSFLSLATPGRSSEFYAYYTTVDSGEPWEQHSRTGKYADVVIHLDEGEFVFSRASSYLPYWNTGRTKTFVDEIVSRKGDGTATMPDRINRYSYVRIIENCPEKAVVHWRYFADFSHVQWDGVVDEYFTLTPDRKVVRTVRKGTEKIDDWNDPANVTGQTLALEVDGIEVTALTPAKIQGRPGEAVQGAPVEANTVGSLVAHWNFDEGLRANRDVTSEISSGDECSISGPKTLWKTGVSGTALAFDGYYSAVTLPHSRTPSVSSSLTVEGWIALGAYPFDWAPIVQQSDWGKRGFFLGIDQRGRPGIHIAVGGAWKSAASSEPVELFRWYHIAGTLERDSGALKLYVDGEEKQSTSVPKEILDAADRDLVIGLNGQKMPPPGRRHRKGKWPSLFGLDGLIDEVRIHDVALDSSDVSRSFESLVPDGDLRDKPDMAPRHFPANPQNKPAERFGAEYARLPYYETWDNLWRVSDHPDVVVHFDEHPIRFAFWRGLSHGIGLITENGKWGGDQSSENYKEIGADAAEGCCEFMSDKQCRHSHVRIIENTDARVVVHWRYGMVDSRYVFPDLDQETGWGDWADEYWTIYPDGVGVRHLERGFVWGDSWVETLFYNQPGTKPVDNIELEALTLVNLEGDSETDSWEIGSPKCDLEDPIISMMNLKSSYRPFNIYPLASSVETFAGGRPFHWWNHFPISQITSDGRGARANDRAAHSSLVWGSPSTNIMMYGLTNRPAKSLLPLARSWNTPPAVVDATGCTSLGYRPEERAYIFTAAGPAMSFRLIATEERPVVNPCFVIKRWRSDALASLTVNGSAREPGRAYRQGVIRDTDGTRTMVIWVALTSDEVVRVEVASYSAESGQKGTVMNANEH